MKSTSVSSLWAKEEKKTLPALILNTTDVGTGTRVPIAPFDIRAAGLRVFHDFAPPTEGFHARRAPSLIEAAVLSARFPFVTAPGSIWVETGSIVVPDISNDCNPKIEKCGADSEFRDFDGFPNEQFKLRLADGGYFESSGVATALDIVEDVAFLTLESPPNLEIHLVVLNALFAEPSPRRSLNELISPFRALNYSRSSRARLTRCLAEKAPPDTLETHPHLCGTGLIDPSHTEKKLQIDLFGHALRIHYNTIDLRNGAAPLGWRLSNESSETLSRQIGQIEARGCAKNDNEVCKRNSAAIASIVNQLR